MTRSTERTRYDGARWTPMPSELRNYADLPQAVTAAWQAAGASFVDAHRQELARDIELLRGATITGGPDLPWWRRTIPGTERLERRVPRGAAVNGEVVDLRPTDADGADDEVLDITDATLAETEIVRCAHHPFDERDGDCSDCKRPFCESCLLRPFGPEGRALCRACALVAAGIRPRSGRSAVYIPRR